VHQLVLGEFSKGELDQVALDVLPQQEFHLEQQVLENAGFSIRNCALHV
jgi:hypothetical protein